MGTRLSDDEDRLLEQAQRLVSSLPSHVYFADEQDTNESLLLGGYFVHREKLSVLDQAVEAVKKKAGLPPEAPVKASPPDKPSFAALRKLPRPQRAELRKGMLGILDMIEAICFFSMVWKYDPDVSPEAYQWAFDNVLQRLTITVERHVKRTGAVWYPALDVVVDWFPNPGRCKDYFGKYHRAYHEGYSFRYLGKNRLPPLKQFRACPCLLVTSCEFSPALQLADYCVSAMGELLRWAYTRRERSTDLRTRVEPVVRHLLRVGGKTIGFGLVLPTTGQARAKVHSALTDLGLG